MDSTFCIRAHYELVAEHDVEDVQWCEVQPAPARYGNLCVRCYGRMNYLIGQVPQLLAHIRSQVAPSMQSARGERVAGTRELQIPLNAKASEDSHDLYAAVANWMTYFARQLGGLPPATLWESLAKDVDVRHLPVWAEQRAAYGLAYDMTSWFQQRRDQAVWNASVGEFHDDLVTTVQPLIRRYPQFEQAKIRKRLCPDCGNESVEARWVGSGFRDVVVDCENRACGWRAPAGEVARFIDWSEW